MVPDALGLAGFTLGKPDGCQFLVLLVSQIPPLAVSVPALVHHLLHERGTAVGLAAAASVRGSHLAFELCFQLLDAALGLLVLLNDRLRALDDLGSRLHASTSEASPYAPRCPFGRPAHLTLIRGSINGILVEQQLLHPEGERQEPG